ncbi:asparaginase [Murimonas intestini]|uniref:asparaginase n=1 Tax=Murimonas intestini TaxID=1337051 RepID=A0AB73T4L4_9FIRM|nr:asparaginase [Murimonas intestini]MCR1840543.1 asparaginase [Murimonas intestini]MCR1865403.1 asparaginase [Murimonas intestini]MCR1882886.1 asparaginase [Murimonas intestini]
MKNFLVLTTGGTIASMEGENGLIPAMGAEDLLSYIPDIGKLCTVDTMEVCNIDSTNMDIGYWRMLAGAIRENYEDYDGFLICHGTDTLAYTASALSYMIQNTEKPVILTGAQKPISFESTDALMNLRDSFQYMMEEDTRGVQVMFGGRAIAGTRAKKINTLSYQAFSSINFPEIAVIRNERVIRYVCTPKPEGEVLFDTRMNPNIFLLKLTPGSSPEILKEIYKQYDGIILEGFGVGGVPDRLFETLKACQNAYPEGQKILVLATQVMSEGSHVSVYEVGKRMEGEMPYLEAKDMNLEAVFAKVAWILGKKPSSWQEIEELFYSNVNFDILGI